MLLNSWEFNVLSEWWTLKWRSEIEAITKSRMTNKPETIAIVTTDSIACCDHSTQRP